MPTREGELIFMAWCWENQPNATSSGVTMPADNPSSRELEEAAAS